MNEKKKNNLAAALNNNPSARSSANATFSKYKSASDSSGSIRSWVNKNEKAQKIKTSIQGRRMINAARNYSPRSAYQSKIQSGGKVTNSETVAEMYRVSGGDKAKFGEMEGLYNQEISTPGSPIYMPYVVATNYKAIDEIASYGIDVSGGITPQWIKDNAWMAADPRTTTTGYGPAAPTKSSSESQNLAWAYGDIVDREPDTLQAENEYAALGKEVDYWVSQGYSDEGVRRKIGQSFENGNYKMLQRMDEERMSNGAVRLNRPVNYYGDDTITGMIYASRNGGGSGDHFVDAVNYHRGIGNFYTPSADSEAAYDPTDYNAYDPYSRGSTMHEINQRTGRTTYDKEWLASNTGMLDTEQGRKDYTAIEKGVINSENAEEEQKKLYEWIDSKIKSGANPEDVVGTLKTFFPRNSTEWNKKYPTLGEAEYMRSHGSYMDFAQPMDFTIPKAEAYVYQSAAKRDAGKAVEDTKEDKESADKKEKWGNIGEAVLGFFGFGDVGANAAGKAKEELEGIAQPIETPEPKPEDNHNIVNSKAYSTVLGGMKMEAASQEEPAEAEPEAETAKANVPSSAAKGEADTKTSAPEQESNMRLSLNKTNGIPAEAEEAPESADIPMPKEAQAAVGKVLASASRPAEEAVSEQAKAPADPERVADFENMLMGGKWNRETYEWALENSTDPSGVHAELEVGISHVMRGESGAREKYPLAASWYDSHTVILGGDLTEDELGRYYNPSDTSMTLSEMQSREGFASVYGERGAQGVYGTRVYEAIQANEEAMKSGAITGDEYIANLIAIGDVTDLLKDTTNGNLSDDSLTNTYLDTIYPEQGDKLNAITSGCNEAMEIQAEQDETRRQETQQFIAGAAEAYSTGTADEEQTKVMRSVLAQDVSGIIKEDNTAKGISGYVDNALTPDALAQRGMWFTNNMTEQDMMFFDPILVHQNGAYLYGIGVRGIANSIVERDVQIATACGMTLEEYYAAYPEQAKTGEQVLAMAEREYGSAYGGFTENLRALFDAENSIGNKAEKFQPKTEEDRASMTTLGQRKLQGDIALEQDARQNPAPTGTPTAEGTAPDVSSMEADKMASLNDMLEDATVDPEDSLSFAQSVELGVASADEGFDLSVDKALNMFLYAGVTSEESVSILRNVYKNDPEAYRADVQAEIDKLPADSTLRKELETKLALYPDPFMMGIKPSRIANEGAIEGHQANVQAIGDTVARYGTKSDKLVFDATNSIASSGMQMVGALGLQALGVPGLAAQILMSAPEGMSTGYDAYQQGASYEMAFAAGVVNTIVTGATEYAMELNYIDSPTKARNILAKFGIGKLGGENPGKLASLANTAIVAGMIASSDAVGEGAQEFIQNISSSITTNLAIGGRPVITAEDLMEAAKAGGMAILTSPILGAGTRAATASYGGVINHEFVDTAGNVLSQAEAMLTPEYEGAIMGAAVGLETTRLAMTEAQDQLSQIANSSEYAAAESAREVFQKAEAAAVEAQQARDSLYASAESLARNFADLNAQMNNSENVSEELAKQLQEMSVAMNEMPAKMVEADKLAKETAAAFDTARQEMETAENAVQALYDSIMSEARDAVYQQALDNVFGGEPQAVRVVQEEYVAACEQLMAAQNDLRGARADMDMYGRGSRASVEFTDAQDAVQELSQKVAALKARVEEAYSNTIDGVVEGMMQEETQEEATPAESAPEQAAPRTVQTEAERAAEEAAADPDNAQKQAYANVTALEEAYSTAEAELATIAEESRKGLRSANPQTRMAAVEKYRAAVADVAAKAENAQTARTEYDSEYTPKGRLARAVEAFKPLQGALRNEYDPNHDTAVEAYKELYNAMQAVDIDIVQRAMTKAMEQLDLEDAESIAELKDAIEAADKERTKAEESTRTESPKQVIVGKQVLAEIRQDNPGRARSILSRAIRRNPEFGERLAELASMSNTTSPADIANNVIEQLMNDGENAARIRAELNSGDWINPRNEAKTGEETQADKNPIEIMRDLTRSIHVGYNPGGSMNMETQRLSRHVLAFYNEFANSITSRTNEAGDLAVGLHEFGHAVQQRLPELRATDSMISNLPQGVRNTYARNEQGNEAVAEFVVRYMYSRDNAVTVYGNGYVQQFEDMLGTDPELQNAMNEAHAQVTLWNNASPESKAAAMIKDGNESKGPNNGNWLVQFLRKVETEVMDYTAPASVVSRDFRQQALYTAHAKRRADIVLTKRLIGPDGRTRGKGFAQRYYESGCTEADQKDVSTYAVLRHALYRLREGKPVFDVHELSANDIQQAMRNLQNKNPNIEAGADAMVSFWSDLMDAWWVDTGMISAEDVEAMREIYPYYVPTFRIVGKNFNQFGGNSARFEIRAANEGGSSLEIIDPLISMVKMTQQMVSTVSHNELMRAFHREMQQGGLGEIAERKVETMLPTTVNIDAMEVTLDAINESETVDPTLMGDAYAEMMNLQEQWYGTGQNFDKNVVSGIDEYGNRFFYQIKDGYEDLYRMLSGASTRPTSVEAGLKYIREFKNMFTKLTTGSNPLFAIKNMQRDFQMAVNTGTFALTYADGVYKWVRAFVELASNSETAQEWFNMGGGQNTYFNTAIDASSAGKVARTLAKELMRGDTNRKGDFVIRGTALDAIVEVFTMERLNELVENTSRFAEYRFGKHDRSTDAGRMEAFMASQNVTTNFGTHGANEIIRMVNSVVPFMNATLQGLNKDAHLIADLASSDPRVRRAALPKAGKTIMNVGLTAMLQFVLMSMYADEEDEEAYGLLAQEMKTGNLIIPIPKAVRNALGSAIGFDKPFIRIPIANSPIAQTLYSGALAMVGNVGGYSPMEIDMWTAAKGIVADIVPDGSVFQAMIDISNNRTWYGGEIENEYQQEMSAGNRYDANTSGVFKAIGRAFNLSPKKLEYFFKQYTGFAGKIIMPLISSDRYGGDNEYTLGGRFVNLGYEILSNYTISPASSNDVKAGYADAKEVIGRIVTDGERNMPMFDVAFSVDPDEALDEAQYMQDEFARIDDEIKSCWADYNEIMASDLPNQEKANMLYDIQMNRIIPLQLEGIALYDEYRMRYIDVDPIGIEVSNQLIYGGPSAS